MARAWLGLGSNAGDKRENLRKALQWMETECRLPRISSLYSTEPVGYKNQDWFLNCAVEIEVEKKPRELLSFLQSVEKRLGRTRTQKNRPRVIDIDILFYDNRTVNERGLVIPHPRLHERMFVLAPLNEIAPDVLHPVLRKTVRNLAASLQRPEQVELAETAWYSFSPS